jgi:hypothetical protein
MNPRVIALCGFEGSGKNMVADYMVAHHGFIQRSFAYNLKKAVAAIFCWDIELLEGITQESRVWREQVDNYWSDKLNIPSLTPRKVLQIVGTDIFREHFNTDIWLHSLFRQIQLDVAAGNRVVITDCRFPNEIKGLKSIDCLLCRVTREAATPNWLSSYEQFCLSHHSCSEELPLLFYKETGIHPAETSLALYNNYDVVLDNNLSIDNLEREIMYKLLL